MRAEYGSDHGLAAAARHRGAMPHGFGVVRAALDSSTRTSFSSGADDQYENFRET